MLDIQESTLTSVDKENMMGCVRDYPEMVRKAIAAASGLDITLPRTPSRILVVGMGGSAISGDYLSAWLDAEGAMPLMVSRNYELPKWVDSDTLVLAFSYSGNTEETLAAFAKAHSQGAMLGAMSTGNRLEQLAKKYEAPFIKVAGGMQPRAALPAAFATSAMFLDAMGLLRAQKSLELAVPALTEQLVDLMPDVPATRNEAKRTALALQDTVPAVYAAGFLAPAATRFANQLNENSKVLAIHGVMPEMNHNELVAWSLDDDLDRFTAIFLRHSLEHAQARERYAFTAHQIQAKGGRVIQLEAKGPNVPTMLLSSSLVGDAASVYLAALRGLDPTPVAVIHELKAKVGETGFAAGIQ